MSKYRPSKIESTVADASIKFDNFEKLLTKHTILINVNDAVSGNVEIYVKLGTGNRILKDTYDVANPSLIFIEGSFDQIDFVPNTVNGDGTYEVDINSTT